MYGSLATLARIPAALALLALLCAPIPQPSAASELGLKRAGTHGSRFLALGIGRSTVVDLPRDAKDVLVANPAIANAVVRSARRAYLIGVAPGQTNVIFFDADGNQMAAYDIEVGRDASGVQEALRRVMPNSSIRVDAVNDSVVLSGEVANAAQAQHAVDAATRLVGDPLKVVNGLTIRGGEQVMLKVVVAEVQRNILKQFGVDMDGSVGIGSAVVGFNTENTFASDPPNTVFSPSLTSPTFSINARIRALEQSGVLRTLAEPNLTAISGESAKFLAGGEFPVVAGRNCDPQTGICETQIEFKEFGVGLNFTPVVLSEGRISLRVATEVSELSREGAIQQAGISIPALRVRRASSTVELPSGGSLVLGGMLQEQTRQSINGVPGLQSIPILGALFRSRDYQNGQTELMIMVTPYTVRPTSARKVARPDDGFANADDPSTLLLGRLNRIYGGRAEMPKRAYHGSYGFIID
ncbi:MAG TPA: type II and III secretion system protein family protein [Xanthobacteraceae bacterium]|nr:type II and III secretion system protein family protein [Xanthobacteraceae bacterium]